MVLTKRSLVLVDIPSNCGRVLQHYEMGQSVSTLIGGYCFLSDGSNPVKPTLVPRSQNANRLVRVHVINTVFDNLFGSVTFDNTSLGSIPADANIHVIDVSIKKLGT